MENYFPPHPNVTVRSQAKTPAGRGEPVDLAVRVHQLAEGREQVQDEAQPVPEREGLPLQHPGAGQPVPHRRHQDRHHLRQAHQRGPVRPGRHQGAVRRRPARHRRAEARLEGQRARRGVQVRLPGDHRGRGGLPLAQAAAADPERAHHAAQGGAQPDQPQGQVGRGDHERRRPAVEGELREPARRQRRPLQGRPHAHRPEHVDRAGRRADLPAEGEARPRAPRQAPAARRRGVAQLRRQAALARVRGAAARPAARGGGAQAPAARHRLPAAPGRPEALPLQVQAHRRVQAELRVRVPAEQAAAERPAAPAARLRAGEHRQPAVLPQGRPLPDRPGGRRGQRARHSHGPLREAVHERPADGADDAHTPAEAGVPGEGGQAGRVQAARRRAAAVPGPDAGGGAAGGLRRGRAAGAGGAVQEPGHAGGAGAADTAAAEEHPGGEEEQTAVSGAAVRAPEPVAERAAPAGQSQRRADGEPGQPNQQQQDVQGRAAAVQPGVSGVTRTGPQAIHEEAGRGLPDELQKRIVQQPHNQQAEQKLREVIRTAL